MHIRSLFSAAEIKTAQLSEPFDFTKEMPVMRINALKDSRRIPNVDGRVFENAGTRLYDLATDPEQNTPIHNARAEQHLRNGMITILQQHDCPSEIFIRMGL